MTNYIETIDGKQIAGNIKSDNCCPPNLCNIDPCGFLCGFLDYLPKGPLWDYWKRFRSEKLISGDNSCSIQGCEDTPACLTIIDHAIYVANKLLSILQNPLQTAIWESNPLTAFNTRSNWLSVLGWNDCFEGPGTFTNLGFPTPYQAVCNAMAPSAPCDLITTTYQMTGDAETNQNPVIDISEQVKAAAPPALTLAVQYGILVALKRLQLGIVRNQENLNFILAPLGAQISMSFPTIDPCNNVPCMEDGDDCINQMTGGNILGDCSTDTDYDCVMVNDVNQMTGTKPCGPYRPCINIVLSKISDTIAAGPGITEPLRCENQLLAKTTIQAFYYFAGISMPVTTECPEGTIAGEGNIWPGLMAAECILISILPSYLNYTLTVTH